LAPCLPVRRRPGRNRCRKSWLVGRAENRVERLRGLRCPGQWVALSIVLARATLPRRRVTSAGWPAHPRGRDTQIGLESRNELPRNAEPDGLLDRIEPFVLLGANQRDRLTARPSPAGATDAMDVLFRHTGKLAIHGVGQVFDVKPARCDI